MAVGLLSYIGIGVESSTGANSAPIMDYLPFISETLAVTRNDLPDPSLAAGWDERKMYQGQQNVGGSINFVFHPTVTGYCLRSLFDTTTADNVAAEIGASNSNAAFRAHRFITKQTQFQAGSASDVPTLTLEVFRGPTLAQANIGSSAFFYNMAGNNGEITIQAGGFVQYNMDMIGRDYAAQKQTAAPTFTPADGFTWNQGSVSISYAGAALAGATVFTNLTFRLENNLQPIPKLDGRLRADLIKRGDFRRCLVNGGLVFQNWQDWNNFIVGSEAQLQCTFYNTNSSMLKIDVPRFRYSTFAPNANGPGPIAVTFTGRGMMDPTSLYEMQVVMVNTRISIYNQNTFA